jgi:ATP-dependent Lon protease
VRYYTREAGVRALERDLSKICRKVVKALLLKPGSGKVRVTPTNLDKSWACAATASAWPRSRRRWAR